MKSRSPLIILLAGFILGLTVVLVSCANVESEEPTLPIDTPVPMIESEEPTVPIETLMPSAVPMRTDTPIIHTATQVPDEPEDVVNTALFNYQADLPLDLTDVIIDQSDDALILHQLTYKGGDGCRVMAYLVTPAGEGPYPAVIYLHKDFGHSWTFPQVGNKDQFLEEAKLLAHYGVGSLLLDAPFLHGCGDVHDQRQGFIRQIVDVRRGVDILESNPIIDPERIGFVGHSYGATWGGIIAGVEPRIKTFVLMGGHAIVGTSSFHSTNHVPKTYDMEPYLYVAQADSVPILFMFANQDEYVSHEKAWLYYNSANDPKEILWYDSSHYDLEKIGQEDRLTWLSEQLGFNYMSD